MPANWNSPYPPGPGFVAQQRLRLMTPPWSSSQDSASVWDPFGGSYSPQSARESYPHDIRGPGGFVFEQGVHAASLYQCPANIQSTVGGRYPTGRQRKAVVIGINYYEHPNRKFRLQHCTQDAYEMAKFLYYKLGFASDDIRIITDDNLGDLPTKRNILRAMKELVRGARPGDSFFFYFSGHGMQIKDLDGDEIDGLDECICAVDYLGDDPNPVPDTPGLIVDDIMHELMVKYLPPQCRLTAMFDCCHSGTILDLPIVYNAKGAAKPFIHPNGPWACNVKMSPADVVSLSASKDNQEAAEFSQGGALRWAFIDCVSRFGNTLTYYELIRNMREFMAVHKFEQKPQLSTSHMINTNLHFVV